MAKSAAGPASKDERRQAILHEQDRAAMIRIGMIHATRIGYRMQKEVLAAFTHGRKDVRSIIAEQIAAAVPLLAQGMTAAWVTGRQRSILSRPARAKLLSLRAQKTPYDTATAAMRKRVDLTELQWDSVVDQFTPEAARIITAAEKGIAAKIQAAIAETTKAGEHVREGRKALAQAFEAAGVSPDNSFTLEAIFRTQTQLAYGAGRWQENQDEAIDEILWGYKYVTVGDDRVRPDHVGFEGVTLPKNDPFWRENWPPNGWACRCSTIEIFEPRKIVRPPAAVEVDGKMIQPDTAPAFRFNPGEAFKIVLAA